MHRSEADDEETRSQSKVAVAAARDDPAGAQLSSQARLIAMLRHQAEVREDDLAELRERLTSAEHELQDLRAIRDALTPPELPARPGLEFAARHLPAAERVGGDFYLVAAGPRDTTVLVIGDVVGHGLHAARRAAFVRTVFVATAPFSDDPAQLLSWVNTALIERAGTSYDFVTAACLTYEPDERRLRCAYAGHPPALRLDDGAELAASTQGAPLGLYDELGCAEGSHEVSPGDGVLLYTDGLTEVRDENGRLLGRRRRRRRPARAARRFAGRDGRRSEHEGGALRGRRSARRPLPARGTLALRRAAALRSSDELAARRSALPPRHAGRRSAGRGACDRGL